MQLLQDPQTPMQDLSHLPLLKNQPQRPRPQPMAHQPAPPPIQPMQQPQQPQRQEQGQPPVAFGSLGGLGGYQPEQQGEGNPFLQAVGMSLMTSPRNAPLSGFPQMYGVLRQASEQRQKSAQETNAIYQTLRRFDVPEEDARAVASNPAAAQMYLTQLQRQIENRRADQEREADIQFQRRLHGGNGNAPSAPQDRAAVDIPAPTQASSGSQSWPNLPAPGLEAQSAQPQGAQTAQPAPTYQEAAERPQQTPQADQREQIAAMQTERQIEQLRARRRDYEQLVPQARNSHQIQQVRAMIEGIDTQIEELAPKSLPETERRIRDLQARGIDRAEAEDVVYGISQIVTDPDLQTPMLVNRITGEARALMAEDPRMTDAQPSSEGATLWDTVGTSTGVIPALQETWTNVAPQLGFPEVPGVVEDRQQFQVATRELVRALSINPRFPVGEMERIEREIDISPNMLRSPESLRQKMRAVDSGLRRRLENETRAAQDPYLPAEQRRNARVAANDIRNFLAVLGVPQGNEPPARGGAEADGQRQEITPPPMDFPDPELWEFISPEDRALWQ